MIVDGCSKSRCYKTWNGLSYLLLVPQIPWRIATSFTVWYGGSKCLSVHLDLIRFSGKIKMQTAFDIINVIVKNILRMMCGEKMIVSFTVLAWLMNVKCRWILKFRRLFTKDHFLRSCTVKFFLFTSEEYPVRIQSHLLAMVLKGMGSSGC